ncbi:MAG: gamma carbonic anhydrase family protein [Myxococcales bacterium]|nr:gamma carbonic anhydrase family protein [Myxococcales bacterium]
MTDIGLILPFEEHTPDLDSTARVMPSATVIGQVRMGEYSCLWFGAVVRGDVHSIEIGDRTNIQDNSVIHVTDGQFGTKLGDDVTVGHRVMLHGCTVGNGSLVGMGSTVLDGAVLEDNVYLGAGSLVTPGTVLPSGMLCYGRPARPVRPLDEKLKDWMKYSSAHYVALMQRYGKMGVWPTETDVLK